MAKLVYTEALASTTVDQHIVDDRMAFDTENFNDQAAGWEDASTGWWIVMSGANLQTDSSWTITGGDINRVFIRELPWIDAMTITGFEHTIQELYDQLFNHSVVDFMNFLTRGDDKLKGSSANDILNGYRGDDTIKGSDGNDEITGGFGSDRLTGGAGSDEFVFDRGHDIVTDFDARGGGEKQDYVKIMPDLDFSIERHGHDTMLDFGHGNTLTLKDVDRSDFSRADIHFFQY